MRIGIIDYLLRGRDSMLPYLASQLGFDAVELSVDRFGDSTRLLFDPERSDDLVLLAKTAGITYASLFATQFLGQNLFDSDPARRKQFQLVVKGLAEKACSIGIPVVVLPLLGASDLRNEADLLALAESLPTWTRWAEGLDIAFAIKTSLYAEQIMRLIDDLPAPHLGISFDPGLLSAIGREPIREWELVESRAIHVHLQDRTAAGLAAHLGEGDAPLRDIVGRIVRSGFGGTIVLSTPGGSNAKENARKNRVTLERLLTLAHQSGKDHDEPAVPKGQKLSPSA